MLRSISSLALIVMLTATAAAQQGDAPAVPLLPVENLGVPVQTMEYSEAGPLMGRDGRLFHIFWFHPMRNPMDCQIRILDLHSGEITAASGPADRMHGYPVEVDGKYYFGHYGSLGLWVFDPDSVSMTFQPGMDLGRCIIFKMVRPAGQKVIYLGASGGAAINSVVSYDTATGEFRDYGIQGPKVAPPRYIYSIAADGRYVYSAAGKNPWYLVALDPTSGQQEVLIREPKYLSVSSTGNIATAGVTVAGSEGQPDVQQQYLLWHGKAYAYETLAGSPAGDVVILTPGLESACLFTAGNPDPVTVALADIPAPQRTFGTPAIGLGRALLPMADRILAMDARTGRRDDLPLPEPRNAALPIVKPLNAGAYLIGRGDQLLVVQDGEPRPIATTGAGNITTIETEDPFAYLLTSGPNATGGRGLIVNTASGAVTAFKAGPHLRRIDGRLYASEERVQIPKGATVLYPARFLLSEGKATSVDSPLLTDTRGKTMEPELVMDPIQPDGSFGVHWRMPGAGADQWRSATTKINAIPTKIERIAQLPDGRLFGNTRRYQDTFFFDPKTSRLERMPGGWPGSGPYMEVAEGKLFAMAYPGSHVAVYDPARPWTLGARVGYTPPAIDSPASNPRVISRNNGGHHVHGSALGADGLIYFGNHAERSAVGGALAWVDPRTLKTDFLRDPWFLVQDCAGLAAARNGRQIIYASRVVTDPTDKIPTPPEARLFVFDTATRHIVAEHVPFAGLSNAGGILARDQFVFGFTRIDNASTYYRFNLDSGKIEATAKFSDAALYPAWGPDGMIWLFVGAVLSRLDPASAVVTPVGALPEADPFIFVGSDLYLAGDPHLRRVQRIAEAPR